MGNMFKDITFNFFFATRALWTYFSEDDVITLDALAIINTFQSPNIHRGKACHSNCFFFFLFFFLRLNHNLVSHPTLHLGNGLFNLIRLTN